jgi:hypothetical protein
MVNGELKLNEINAIKVLIKSEIKLGKILIYEWLEEKPEPRIFRSFTKQVLIAAYEIIKFQKVFELAKSSGGISSTLHSRRNL